MSSPSHPSVTRYLETQGLRIEDLEANRAGTVSPRQAAIAATHRRKTTTGFVVGFGTFFVSALCVAWPDGHLEEFEARVNGTLVWPPRGDAGFGYDPMFLPDGHTRTFGEMTSDEKHGLPPRGLGLSHRARADGYPGTDGKAWLREAP